MALCSITIHGTMFSQKSCHHVQSQIMALVQSQFMAPCSVNNHGTMYDHKSWHRVQ